MSTAARYVNHCERTPLAYHVSPRLRVVEIAARHGGKGNISVRDDAREVARPVLMRMSTLLLVRLQRLRGVYSYFFRNARLVRTPALKIRAQVLISCDLRVDHVRFPSEILRTHHFRVHSPFPREWCCTKRGPKSQALLSPAFGACIPTSRALAALGMLNRPWLKCYRPLSRTLTLTPTVWEISRNEDGCCNEGLFTTSRLSTISPKPG